MKFFQFFRLQTAVNHLPFCLLFLSGHLRGQQSILHFEVPSELLFQKPEKPTKSFHLGIEEKLSGKVIGDLWVYLIENDRMASVAIRLAPACQGKGYGTEALSEMTRFCFENTQLQRLWTKVDVRNIPSQRMLEKCGYIKEGLIRQGKMTNTWCDYYIYGILSSDKAGR